MQRLQWIQALRVRLKIMDDDIEQKSIKQFFKYYLFIATIKLKDKSLFLRKQLIFFNYSTA